MTRNQEVAAVLYEIAQILELQGVAFKPRAYQRAAMNIESLGEDVEVVVREDRLGEVPGVGRAIEEKVREFLERGRLKYLDQLRKEVPRGLLEILQLPGVGPKTASRLYQELKVTSVSKLKQAAAAGRLRTLKGFGEKTEQEILRAIDRVGRTPSRHPYPTALEVASDLIQTLRATGKGGRMEAAGSLRRGRDTVGDVDLLVEASEKDAPPLIRAFTQYRRVKETLEAGGTRARVLLDNGIGVDLRVVPAESYGAALCYFTGSKDHNIALRSLALKRGLTLNEYALARKATGRAVAGKTEEEIYQRLGLAWIPPERRENRGEIEQARARRLPALLELSDLRGDLHTHTDESDGNNSAAEMVAAAEGLKYSWYGISDHSRGLGIARGLDGPRFARQRRALDALQRGHPRLRILQGSEVNILKDGRLDLDRKVLASLDYAIGSVHSAFDLPRAEQTRRVLRALDAGIDVLGHPTGRLLGERDSIHLDWDHVVAKAVERGVLLEINASPFRLDLWGELIQSGRERGARFAINSDAHQASGLRVQSFGVTQARRGGLRAGDVANTLEPAKLDRWLGHAKSR